MSTITAALIIFMTMIFAFAFHILVWLPRRNEALNKRGDLRMKSGWFDGEIVFFVESEIIDVSVYRHTLSLLLRRQWVHLYGPLCQHLHWFNEGQSNPRDRVIWWQCYVKVYFGLCLKEKRKISRRMVIPFDLPTILSISGHSRAVDDIYKDIAQKSNSCGIGAQEYEEIMQVQDIVL